MNKTRLLAVGAIVVVVLAGCAPTSKPESQHTNIAASAPTSTPTPTPTAPPALSDLVLSPDGLGPLVLGSPVPDESASTAVVLWDPTKCGTTGAWLPNYPDGPTIYGNSIPFQFALDHQTDPLTYLVILSPSIRTTTGISLGDTLAQVKAAYPTFDAVISGPQTDLYVVDGAAGELVVEIGKTGAAASAVGKVADLWIRLKNSTPPGSIDGNDAGGGICPDTE